MDVGSLIDQPQNARSRRTARQLLAAARTLIEEEGFEAMTMAAVAQRDRDVTVARADAVVGAGDLHADAVKLVVRAVG